MSLNKLSTSFYIRDLDQDAFPHPVLDLEILETHISWVVLTGHYAYKIKKPVDLGFLDFTTLELRRHFCEEELRLNRNWAPTLYLGVVAICDKGGRPVVDGDGPPIEYAVKMRQFPQSARLDAQLDAGLLRARDVHALANTIAENHAGAAVAAFDSAASALDRVSTSMQENFPPLEALADAAQLGRIRDWTEHQIRENSVMIARRHEDGFVRECHGDLHLANLVRLDTGIVAFDCVEFSRDLRTLDVINDVAFLAMDLIARKRRDLAYVFLNRYLECTGDYVGMALYGLYFVYHCMIRAKVAAIRNDVDKMQHYVDVALRWIDRKPAKIAAMHGLSGSGKTTLSDRLLPLIPALRVRSDVERKRLFGLRENQSSDSGVGAGIYTDDAKSDVYSRALEIADGLLVAGLNVIVDASFLRHSDRQRLTTLARRHDVDPVWLDTSAPDDELARRLVERARSGRRISEADVRVLESQMRRRDLLTPEERTRTVAIDTTRPIDWQELRAAIVRKLSAPNEQA